MPKADPCGGYASDDEVRRRRVPFGYGELPGDQRKRQLTEQDKLEYRIRQSSAGPPVRKPRYIDSLGAPRSAKGSTHSRTAFERHCQLLHWLPCMQSTAPYKNDLQLLQENHRFLRTGKDDDGSWEAQLARRYYDRLFKEYVICDLTSYKTGDVGFRWRTESEVVQGKGQFFCGHRKCSSKLGLQSYEVYFKYHEAGEKRRALVKARLCQACAYKLHYRRLKEEKKRHKAIKKKEHKKVMLTRGSSVVIDLDTDYDDSVKSDPNDTSDEKLNRGALEVPVGDAPQGSSEFVSREDMKIIESLAWKGPDPDLRTREDEFDDYLRELFA